MILHLIKDIKTGKPVEVPDNLSTEQIAFIHDKADVATKRLRDMFSTNYPASKNEQDPNS